MTIRPPRIGPQPWQTVRGKLDQSLPFANMRDTPRRAADPAADRK